MAFPCDDMHWHWLPAVTGALCRSLSQEGWSGTKIAKALGITSASVSYFLKYKRGTTPLPPAAMGECLRLCGRIRQGKLDSQHIQLQMAKIAVMARHSKSQKMQNEMLALCKSCIIPKMKTHNKIPSKVLQ